MKIIAFGDIHMDYGAADSIPGIRTAHCVIVTGDFTNYGHSNDAEKVLAAIRGLNPRIYAIPGNLDQNSVLQHLESLGINLHGKGLRIGNLGIFGVGGSNPTPFNTPTEFSEKELGRIVREAHASVKDVPVRILVSHTPPFDTATDRIASGLHVGSREIRRFIEETQPDVCFTGHIHESRGTDRIGRTLILNPGMLRDLGWIEFEMREDGTWTASLNG